LERFPQYKQYRVAGGFIHKDVFLKAALFQQVLETALRECLKTGSQSSISAFTSEYLA